MDRAWIAFTNEKGLTPDFVFTDFKDLHEITHSAFIAIQIVLGDAFVVSLQPIVLGQLVSIIIRGH